MITADSNVFVYLWDNDEPRKMAVAQRVVAALGATHQAVVGLQVVGEVQNVLRRKLRQPPWEAAQNARNILATFDTFGPTESNVSEALALMSTGRMAYWDALLVTAARDAGCAVFLTEDMEDGARHGSIEIINPFGPNGPSSRVQQVLAL
ncbi:MAG TPA: PIN domain-containing protein [Caulobacteraceae bacterium]|jgi:predicted nucleic acid-binding protein|nr:PIN domain-containing protein [Caulobacteraceae bacterium]